MTVTVPTKLLQTKMSLDTANIPWGAEFFPNGVLLLILNKKRRLEFENLSYKANLSHNVSEFSYENCYILGWGYSLLSENLIAVYCSLNRQVKQTGNDTALIL